jgi:asparagine synthase (glutamine-hydrolysing)
MRRLSIIDLTTGWQPLYNEDRTLALICNGEIYNFVELRERLESLGHRFSTNSDCETILHLYEEHGLDCVQHLRGMFAFALYDTQRKRLLLARDRMGEKPLYLYQTNSNLFFASEMKALLASGLVPFELDPNAVNLYFHYQYVPEPLTPLKGVRKLDAACLLTVDIEDWRIEEKCYWRMEDAPPLEGDPARHIREQLEVVGEIVIRSDVPVGVALSGGLDSSAIASLAASKYPGTMHAFSIGYPDSPETDERADARALADHLGLPFHDVELSTSEMVSFFPELVSWRDDPIADIAGYGYYSVMKLAREHSVPVVLQGQGGDELFWGYPWVRDAARQTERKVSQRHRTSITALSRVVASNRNLTLRVVAVGPARWRAAAGLAKFSARSGDPGKSVCVLRLHSRIQPRSESNGTSLRALVSRAAKRIDCRKIVHPVRTIHEYGDSDHKTHLRHLSARKRDHAGRSLEHGVVNRITTPLTGLSTSGNRDRFAQSEQRSQ